MTDQFIAYVRATGADGKPVPSPTGPFPTREAAWKWIWTVPVAYNETKEANVGSLHAPEPSAPPQCQRCKNRPAELDGFCDPCIDRCHESTELQHSCAVCRAYGTAVAPTTVNSVVGTVTGPLIQADVVGDVRL